MKISILSDDTINKIAAGEVIERPQNVVKELVENSLDAGATSIDVEIEGAGSKLVRVRDNGFGMSREEVTLSVTRHATSKIKSFEDIYAISSMGFRGEALPSIASVSHLSLMSQERGANTGWQIKLSGGKLLKSNAWAGASGTIAEVSYLFFNTPARQKFLKSEQTEKNHIVKIIEELALGNPHIAFKLTSDKKKIIDAPATKKAMERVTDILGKDFSEKLISFKTQHSKISIDCFVTDAQKSLATRNFQYLFVNRRPVTLGRNITHALYEAYRENLERSRHPGALIYMDIDPSVIDVNIHPTKREVKFSNEREIHDFIYREIKNHIVKAVSIVVDNTVDEYLASAATSKSNDIQLREAQPQYKISAKEREVIESKTQSFDFSDSLNDTAAYGQIFGLYVLASKGRELFIVDQHAAQERIKYEEYMQEALSGKIPVQGLLIPKTFDLPPSRSGVLKENLDLLKEAGWEIVEFGKDSYRISALPGVLGNERDVEEILNAVIDSLIEERKSARLEKIEVIISAACKASVKKGDTLDQKEISQLIKDLFKCKAPYTCPHGRPTLLKMSKEELEKHFKRS